MTFPPINPKRQSPRNPGTHRAHRSEVIWQILLPLFLGVLISAVLFYLLLAGGPLSLERGAQIAVMLLAIPILLVGAALLVLMVVVNRGVSIALEWLPEKAPIVQRAVENVNAGTQKTASAITRAILKLESWGTATRKIFRRNRIGR